MKHKNVIFFYLIPVVALILFTSNFSGSRGTPDSVDMIIPQATIAAQVQNVDFMPDGDWALVFHDEFDGDQLNRKTWTDQYLWGRTNPPELQYYAMDAFKVSGGRLEIIAEERKVQEMHYSSGVITSFDSFVFTRGYVEARIRIPSGQGLWPAVWLLDAGGEAEEIDVVEFLGHEPNRANMTFHYTDQHGNVQAPGIYYQGPDFSKEFHVYGLNWSLTSVIWYIDGVERYRIDHDIPNAPMYLIANLAVGGSWPGSPDDSTQFPAVFEMDYIRVFQQ